MTISEGIVIAIITSLASVFGVIYSANKGKKEMSKIVQIGLEYKDKELESRLKTIEQKMDKHNNFIQRLTVVEVNQKNIVDTLNEIKRKL